MDIARREAVGAAEAFEHGQRLEAPLHRLVAEAPGGA